MSLQTKVMFEFGCFRLNSAERLLLREEVPVQVPPKAFDALVVLVENRGRLLGKDELLRKVWPDTFVEESNLAQHISILRKALRDGEEGAQYIETVPRFGYRFIAKVREVSSLVSESSAGGADLPPALPPVARIPDAGRRPRRLRAVALAIAGLAVLLLVLAATPILRKRLRSSGPGPIQSLAVLPLQNLSGDPAQDYFADGMTETLITDLAKIPGLKVISRTSIMQYKGSHERLPQIARELGVDAIVEGAVAHSGGRVRVTAQLVRAATDQHIWAESYERDMRDLLALQDDVSRSIASQIEKQVTSGSPRTFATSAVSVQARENYLKGRYFWNQRSEAGYLKAIDYFQAAVAEDPQYSQAYAGLADTYALLGSTANPSIPRGKAMPQAKETALTALKLDDTLADAHTSLAFVEMHYEWNFRKAEQEFKRAIDLDPNYSTAHEWYAFDLLAMGRPEEAIAEIKQAQQTDPLSAIVNTDFAEVLYFARDYDGALQQARATIEMDPNFAHAHRVLGRTYDQKKMFPEAIAEGKRAVALTGEDTWMLLDLAQTYALAGNKGEMRNCLQRAANASPGGKFRDAASMAEIYATLGEVDRAFQVLEARYAQRDGALILLNADPDFDSLKSDPRFKVLTQRVGLPQSKARD